MLEGIAIVIAGLVRQLWPAAPASVTQLIVDKLPQVIDNITNPERREVEMRVAAAQIAAGEIPSILRGRDE